MIGLNAVQISGNAGSEFTEGQTSDGTPALSFDIVCETPRTDARKPNRVWTRINVYDTELLARIRHRLARGVYLIVHGELMNRRGRNTELLEIRATQIIALNAPPGGPTT